MAEAMYGGGLRLMELLRLRVKDLDLEQEIITGPSRSGSGAGLLAEEDQELADGLVDLLPLLGFAQAAFANDSFCLPGWLELLDGRFHHSLRDLAPVRNFPRALPGQLRSLGVGPISGRTCFSCSDF
jgi:hypothetical protein